MIIFKSVEKALDIIRGKSISFQNYINTRYKGDKYLLINKKYLIDSIYKIHGKCFYVTECMESLDTIKDDYIYNDIKNDDVVVDIGANIGGFSIPVSDVCHHIYAIEPLFSTELVKNLKLNNVKNCTVISKGLGIGYMDLEYHSKSKNVKCMSLTDIKNIVGGKIDFLKIDCEGGEWCITADELINIKRIEMELHLFNGEDKNCFLNVLNKAGFEYNIVDHPTNKKLYFIHAKNTNVVL